MQIPDGEIKYIPLAGVKPAGIACLDGRLWVTDTAQGLLVEVDPASGTILRRLRSPVCRPTWIAADDGELFVVDEQTQDVFRYDLAAGELRPWGGVPEQARPYLGIAADHDTVSVLACDGAWYPLRLPVVARTPRRSSMLEEDFAGPAYGCRGLAAYRGTLLTADPQRREAYRLDPASGLLLDAFPLPGESLLGLAETDGWMWSVDLRADRLVGMACRSAPAVSTGGSREHELTIGLTCVNSGPGRAVRWQIPVDLPLDDSHQRVIGPVEIEPEPQLWLEHRFGDRPIRIPVVVLEDLAPGATVTIRVRARVRAWGEWHHVDPAGVAGLEAIPDEVARRYLLKRLPVAGDDLLAGIRDRQLRALNLDSEEIAKAARDAAGGETNPYRLVRKMFDWLIKEVGYALPYRSVSLRKLLRGERRTGACGNHTNLVVSLCNQIGLPARSIVGYALWQEDSRQGYLDHELPEVYLPGYGWLPLDTSRFLSIPNTSGSPSENQENFGRLSERFVTTGAYSEYDTEFSRWSFECRGRSVLAAQTELRLHPWVDWRSRAIVDE